MNMIEKFLDYLKYERNRSELTVQSYERSLREFESYFKNREGQLSWESIDSDVIRDWMESLMDKGDMASTVNRCLSAVRSFYRFALSRRLVKHDPSHVVKGPKKQKPLPQFVRENEMDRLLDIKEMWGSQYKDVRARTIIITFYSTGVRLAELVGLNTADVDFTSHQLKVTGKRNKQRIIPFGAELEKELQNYIALRDTEVGHATDPLFTSEKGERIKRSQVEKLVKDHLSLVTTLKKRSPHVLRHSFATEMLRGGADIKVIQELMGHASSNTTGVYLHLGIGDLQKVKK